MNATTTIEISVFDLSALRTIQGSWGDIAILVNSGVFNFKNGVAELHRDNEGKLRQVNINERKYKV